MTDHEHHLQDAAELYAVLRLQQLAEGSGAATAVTSPELKDDFERYLEERRLEFRDFASGEFPEYHDNVEKHIPFFFKRLMNRYPTKRLGFTNIEVEYRRRKLKGDFLIAFEDGGDLAVSLKNYRGSAARPQVCSGTFNSFLLNFLFASAGVGTHLHPATGVAFRGADRVARDTALTETGFGALVPVFEELDELNAAMRARFLDSAEFEYLNESTFDVARKEVGNAGADATLRALERIDPDFVRERILQMVGLDSVEEVVMFDPVRYTDSITVDPFHALIRDVQNPMTVLSYERVGQGLQFQFKNGALTVLKLDVPFTINKNGAWISGKAYSGTRYHRKEKVDLAYGQRRPKKSRELATSINTWVDFESAGIFIRR